MATLLTCTYISLAITTAERQEESAVPVLHLMEAERIAPEILTFNIRSRALLADLLSRERQSVTLVSGQWPSAPVSSADHEH
ncbi:hypothetical protein GCM10027280_41260 [Micromonospora polyrhachis]